MKLYKYSGTIEEFAVERGRISYIKLFDVTDFDKAPTRLEVFGALSEYIEAIESTDAEERYIKSDWYFDSNLYLYRIEIPGSEDIAAWVDTATELSTASLQRELQKTGSLALRKLQEWNNACNRRIQALEPTFEPFPGVEESLRQLHAVADVAVVSAANESAIASEWKRYGLARHADVIFGQEVGSKANSIATMLACGYESRKVMMVGDAMGDAQAAAANGVAFVPILPGREAASWRRLQEEALPKLLHGTFSPAYQAELIAALRSALHG